MKAAFASYILNFKVPGGTSRGVLKEKQSYFIVINDQNRIGLGEVGILRGLSCDDQPGFEEQLKWTCENISLGLEKLYLQNKAFPSIQFALEQAFSHLENGFEHYPSKFTKGHDFQSINGLIWMGDEEFMREQVELRLAEGFKTLKMKVGAIGWEQEKDILTSLRRNFNPDQLELRVDANGAFELEEAVEVSAFLSDISVHSMEQPLKAGRNKELALAAQRMHLPIALDESLIGLYEMKDRAALLDEVQPQYIILKPSFIGGWRGSDEWITLAEERGIGWWATSALESNIGLNAIAQWAYTKSNPIPQGLGTGSLYTNNIAGPYRVEGGRFQLVSDLQKGWDLSPLKSILEVR